MFKKILRHSIYIFLFLLVFLFIFHTDVYADVWPTDYKVTLLDDWFFYATSTEIILRSIYGGFIINYLINFLIVIVFAYLRKLDKRFLFHWNSVSRLFFVTIAGLVIDAFALIAVGFLYVQPIRSFIAEPFQKIVSSPLFLFSYPIVGLLVFIGVSFVFYKVYSPLLFEDVSRRKKYSYAFGILSNPIWYVVLLIIFPDLFPNFP